MSIIKHVRGRLSGYQANIDPHEWRLPSSYSTSESSSRDTTVVPNPTIFRNVFVPSDPSLGIMEASLVYPDIGHAALHLALLECFRKLRLTASKLNIEVEQLAAYSEKPDTEENDSAASPTRLPESERWDILLRLAITRFTAWWMNIDRVLYHATAFTHHAGDKSVVQLTKDYLPPLDVLLVWYAFMLDDEIYTATCSNRASSKVGEICFPWPAIRDALDLNTMTYTLPRAAENLFSTLTSQSADILTYLESPPAYAECSGELPVKVDLFDNVKQQEKFMDMAHDLFWIRSPALKGSLERASVDYLELQLSSNGDDMPSPSDIAFGVDLIWKTHRLYPIQYQLFRRQRVAPTWSSTDTKRPPSPQISVDSLDDDDDDDDDDEEEEEEEEETTHASSECCCWTCERIRDEIPSFSYAKSTSTPAAYDMSLVSSLSSEQLRSIQDDLGFYKAVERARRRGLPLPKRPPTATEKAAEKQAAKKQAEIGRLPGLNEYVVTLPNGKKKIKRAKRVIATYGMMV
ncbi:hypothetical protein RBB50_007638 [Rhinocladiella similis]